MNSYITGETIRQLREKRAMTQLMLAEKLGVSDKTVSKWETARGYPDITLVQPLAETLGVSVVELLSGGVVTNSNRSFNMKRSVIYVCPLCGNVIVSTGEAVVCCCGITLPPAEPEQPDCAHDITAEVVEDEYFISSAHPMSKEHYISFFAAVTDSGLMLQKLYPEGSAEARFKINKTHAVHMYCNRHGLFRLMLPARRPQHTAQRLP